MHVYQAGGVCCCRVLSLSLAVFFSIFISLPSVVNSWLLAGFAWWDGAGSGGFSSRLDFEGSSLKLK